MTSVKKVKIGRFIKYLFFLLYFTACTVAIAESCLPSEISAEQSDSLAGNFDDSVNDMYDEDKLIPLNGFNITFSSEKKDFKVGESINYEVSYLPENTSYKGIEVIGDNTYFTSNPDSSITFIKAVDNLNISFVSTHNKDLVKTFAFNVTNINVKTVSITNKPLQVLDVGSNYQLNFEVKPQNATNKEVQFVSSNEEVAFINQNGLINAKKEGKTEITLLSKENNSIKDSFILEVKNKEDNIEKKVESIVINDVSLYALNDEVRVKILVNPLDANFDSTKAKISNYENLKIRISGKELIINSPNVNEEKLYENILFEYQSSEELIIKVYFNVKVVKKNELSLDLINKDNLTLNYEPTINYVNETFSIESFVINIPFNHFNDNEYVLNNYSVKFDNENLTLVSSTYKRLVFKLKDISSSRDGKITYYFNKNNINEFIEFAYSYQENHEVIHLEKISLTRLFTDEDSLANPTNINLLYKGIKERNLFTKYQIEPNQYSNTDLFVNVLSGHENIEFYDSINGILDNNLPINIHQINYVLPIKNGDVKFKLSSDFDKEGSHLKDLNYTFKIVDEPTDSKLFLEKGNKICEVFDGNTIDLGIKDLINMSLKFEFNNAFKDGYLVSHEVSYPYSVKVDGDDILYNEANKTFTPLKTGLTRVDFIVLNHEELSKSIFFNVFYVPIKVDEFKLNLSIISYPENNVPDLEKDVFAVGSTFKIDYSLNQDATYKEVKFASSNEEIISIENGIYKALKEGVSTITCQSIQNPEISVSKNITVVDAISPFVLDNTSLNAREFNESENNGTKEYSITLLYGESYKLAPKFSDYATSKKVDYEIIEGNDFINIDASGQISLKNIGNVKVKMSCGDNNSLFKYSVILNINIIRDTTDVFKEFALFIRKSFGHFGLFFFIGFLSCVFMVIQFKSFFTRVLASMGSSCLGIGLAILTEFIQKFVPGRGPSLKDVGIDAMGYLSAMIIFIIVVGIIYIVKKVKASKVDKKYSIVSKPSTFKTID